MKIYNLLIAAGLFYGLQASPSNNPYEQTKFNPASIEYYGEYSEPITSAKGFIAGQKYNSECRHNLVPDPTQPTRDANDRYERWQKCVNKFVFQKNIKYKNNDEMIRKTRGTDSEYYERDLDALCDEGYKDFCRSSLF